MYWRRYKIQETLYIGQWHLGPLQSRHLGTSHSSPSQHQLLIVFSWISSMVWNLFPFKHDFSLGKSQKSQGTKSGLKWGWVTWVMWCFTKKFCTRGDVWVGVLWWSCRLPVAHSCSLLNHPNSFHGGMFKLDAKFLADLMFYLFSHFECNGLTMVSTRPTDQYSEVIIVHACAFQSTLLGCQVTFMLCKSFSLY